MLTSRNVLLCLEVGGFWRPLLRRPTLSPVSKSHGRFCLHFSLFLFLSACFCTSLSDDAITHSCAKVLPSFILWTPPANPLAFFPQPGDTVLVVFRPASPRATTHLHRRHAKSPCQLDMTHAMPHTHHCDNPVMINTNLSASARGAKVLWSWRKGEGGGERHTDTLSTGRGTVISGSGIRQQVWMWLCTQDSQTRGRLIPAPPSALTAVVSTWRRRRWGGLTHTHTEERREGE